MPDLRFTLMGAYSYDNDLFSEFAYPEGMDGDTLFMMLMDRCGDLYLYHQNVPAVKSLIGAWSYGRLADWEKAWAAVTAEYNPVHNYYKEELGSEDTARHKGTRRSTGWKETETPGVTMTDTGSRVAYDSATEKEVGKTTSVPTGYNTREGLASDNTETYEDISASVYDHDTLTFDGRITQGNIGVTKSQDMVRDEVDLRFSVSVYEKIISEFEEKFLVQVY